MRREIDAIYGRVAPSTILDDVVSAAAIIYVVLLIAVGGAW